MTVFPSLPSISLELLVFWPVRAPAHFLSLSQIPLSFSRAAHTAPGSSSVLEWPGGPVQLAKHAFMYCPHLFLAALGLRCSGFLSWRNTDFSSQWLLFLQLSGSRAQAQ